jgi:hypothetical protein
MGCDYDDALEVEEFVVVRDYIDDMLGCQLSNIGKTENLNKILIR